MTLYLSNRDGNGKTNEEGHYKFPVNTWSGTVLTSADLLVTQQSTPALGVKIATGTFKILDLSGNYSFTGWNNADINLSITTADPANPRISAIVLYVDKSASTSASPPNNPGVVKVMSVNGTAAAVPSAPNGATIQAAVGAANPYIVLAYATVAAAGTTVLNAAISDQRTLITVAANLVNTASIQDNAISKAKMQDNSVDTAEMVDLAATTRKMKPTYVVVAGNNGGSRQQFPTANTTYTITGTAYAYTSGPTAEVLDISAQGLISATTGGGMFFIQAGSTVVSKGHYNINSSYQTHYARTFYNIAANTTVTISAAFRTSSPGGGEVCNTAVDQSQSPSYGVELRIIAWGRT
jgi:hypothetical protein